MRKIEKGDGRFGQELLDSNENELKQESKPLTSSKKSFPVSVVLIPLALLFILFFVVYFENNNISFAANKSSNKPDASKETISIHDVLNKKRTGQELTTEEIQFFVKGYVNNEIKDYQASALLMAICTKGMTIRETTDLTEAMRVSGEIWDLSDIPGLKLDKHSTGGVGDKVSLILGPMVASLGGKLAKMSGKGLGHSGGTLDKMESIPGMRINLSKEEFKKQVKDIGIAIIGQDKEIDPADKKIYALRDVTGTVASLPLIASSIMSKKLASGADCILLDVKYGSGAFMSAVEDAKELAKVMVDLGKMMNKNIKAEVTSMEQPLGNAVGNNLEIKEVIDTLKGKGPKDITEICLHSGSIMLVQGKIFNDVKEARKKLEESIKNGKAFEKFKEFVKAQGGDVSYIDDPKKFPVAKNVIQIKSTKSGYIKKADALTIGKASVTLGGGRNKMDDVIDYSAGIIMSKKIGDEVKEGDVLCTLYTNKDESVYKEVAKHVQGAFDYSDSKVSPISLVNQIIE